MERVLQQYRPTSRQQQHGDRENCRVPFSASKLDQHLDSTRPGINKYKHSAIVSSLILCAKKMCIGSLKEHQNAITLTKNY